MKIHKIIILCFLALSTFIHAQERERLDNYNSFLNSASMISVTIGGSFIVNGSYPASPMERVDQFITRIFNLYKAQAIGSITDQEDLEMYSIELDNYAHRGILLKRYNGEEKVLDLEKFRITGNFENNPYLKNDDVIIFPKVDFQRNFVSVDGAINSPVKFQFVEGDKLSDALLFAQGISKAYEGVSKAEIARISYDGLNDETIVVDITSDIPLKRGDRIRVLADETMKKDYTILVLGEVNKPGYIPITKNSTVRQVIDKAGGFKKTASLFRSELIRNTDSYTALKKDILTKNFAQNKFSNEKIELQLYENREMEKLLMSRMAYLTEDDTAYFKIDNELRLLKASGQVDFSKIYSDTSEGNFHVKDGDIIIIPEENNLVYVFGQVSFTGYVRYEEGQDVNYYVQKAGGLGDVAKDIDEAWIIKAKARNWIKVEETENIKIEPGDYIWVPKKAPRTFNYYLQRVSTIAAVVGSMATLILLFTK